MSSNGPAPPNPGSYADEFDAIPDLVDLNVPVEAPVAIPLSALVHDVRSGANTTTDGASSNSANPAAQAEFPTSEDVTTGVVPLTILTGWLGAGKTTFLHHLVSEISRTNRRAAILQNETSSLMGVERSLALTDANGTVGEVFELGNGCVCCSVRSDFSSAVEELLARRRFDFVIVECSGLADPGRLANSLWADDELGGRVYLDAIIAFVDAPAFADSAANPFALTVSSEAVKQATEALRTAVAQDPSIAGATDAIAATRAAEAASGDSNSNGPRVIAPRGIEVVPDSSSNSNATATVTADKPAAPGQLSSETDATAADVSAMISLQISDADVIVLNKADLFPQSAVPTSVTAAVQALNPSAAVVAAERSRVPLDLVLNRRALRLGAAATGAAVTRAFGGDDKCTAECTAECAADCAAANAKCTTECTDAAHSHSAQNYTHRHNHKSAHSHSSAHASASSIDEQIGSWLVSRTGTSTANSSTNNASTDSSAPAAGTHHGLSTILLRRRFPAGRGFDHKRLQLWLTTTLDDANVAYTVAQQQAARGADAETAAAAARAAWVAEGAAADAGRRGMYFLRTKGVVPVQGELKRWYLQAVRETFDLAPATAHALIDLVPADGAVAANAENVTASASASESGANSDVWSEGKEREARIAVIGLGLDAKFICEGLETCID